jgi:hypothetical protein
VLVDGPRSKCVVGDFRGKPFALGDVRVDPGATRQGWAVVTLTARDGANFSAPGRVLVTATGMAENTGMKWTDAEKTSVGTNWGKAPSLVEGVAATITLPAPAGRVRAWALDERGARGKAIIPKGVDGRAALAVGPEFKTVWYEVEIGNE